MDRCGLKYHDTPLDFTDKRTTGLFQHRFHPSHPCLSAADQTPTDLDDLLAQLESMLNTLLNTLGPELGLTEAQIKQAEADIDTLIKDIEDIEHGNIDIDGGLEKIIVDIFNILKDFGLPVLRGEIGKSACDTSPKSK